MHLYIALSTISQHTSNPYHWALVPSNGPPTGTVNLYQINGPDGVWKLEHDRLRLTHLPSFIGCVCLSPTIAERTDHIDAFIREFPAEQGRYCSDGSAGWSCARWIMRCLEGLVEAGILEVDMSGLYECVLEKGGVLEAARAEGREEDGVTVVDGVPIIDL